jgi:ubiquinone/menaquinone biosynthesis C-methylase UbiE
MFVSYCLLLLLPILSSINIDLKQYARKWFIKRAELSGIPWTKLTQKYVDQKEQLQENRKAVENPNIEYPSYYLKPFHGYNDGNLNWDAAYELEAATMSISVNYWPNEKPTTSEKWLRENCSKIIDNYYFMQNLHLPERVVDLGCSIGISTKYLQKQFGSRAEINGVDLSPYFLSVAKHLNPDLTFYHGKGEDLSMFDDESVDLVSCNFLFHEVPYLARCVIFDEIYRKLKPNGVFHIIDLDPVQLKNRLLVNNFRRWAFESTEPHIVNYYDHEIETDLRTRFRNVVMTQNDPLNRVWMCMK